MSLYSSYDNEANIKNELIIKKKNRLLGFILVLGMGCVGALYYGWKHAVELFLYSVGVTFFSLVTAFIPNPITAFIAGILALLYVFKCLSMVFDDNNHYEFTEKGLEEKRKWDKETNEALNKTVHEIKEKTANVLATFAEKITDKEKVSNQSSDNICYCSDCGGKVTRSAKFCNSCGIKLNEVA